MSAVVNVVTADEFWAISSESKDHGAELILGKVVPIMPPGGIHSRVSARIARFLDEWAERSGQGLVGADCGFILARNPDTVRAPDVYFVRRDRLPDGVLPLGYLETAPDLAVEIVSPSNTAIELQQRMDDYFAAGTRRVWLVFPETSRVIVHYPNGTAKTLTGDDILGDAPRDDVPSDGSEGAQNDVLPGLTVTVRQILA